jgi:hypothetical protein
MAYSLDYFYKGWKSRKPQVPPTKKESQQYDLKLRWASMSPCRLYQLYQQNWQRICYLIITIYIFFKFSLESVKLNTIVRQKVKLH